MTMGINPNGEYKRIRVDEEGKLLISGQSAIVVDPTKVSKSGDTMTGELLLRSSNSNSLRTTTVKDNPGVGVRQGDELGSYVMSGTYNSAGARVGNVGASIRGIATHNWYAGAYGANLELRTNNHSALGAKVNMTMLARGGVALGTEGSPAILTGTGFPNGVVSAPVGSTYIDTNATNGAIEWKKATGTGNTGWVVSVGDTGWRDISADLSSGWSGTAALLVRRIGSSVEIRFVGLSDATATSPRVLGGINMGFRPETTAVFSTIGITTAAYPTSVARTFIDIYGDIYANTTRPSASTFSGSLTFNTSRSWPTTLPGTAV